VILAIDTATRFMSLALASEEMRAAERSWPSQNNHTIELAPAVERLLSGAGVRPNELTALAVAIGPGSFTGVRIGLGFAKGLALAGGLPLIGVKTLDIVVRELPLQERQAIAVIQAGRGRVIWAPYTVREQTWEPAHDGVVGSWDEVSSAAMGESVVIGEIDPAGWESLRQRQVRAVSSSQHPGRAARLAEIGWARWRRGALDSAATLIPVYAHSPASGTQS
jgi:tRNA threonylcarbamoyladenosine biosynthesis protein TsaB